MTAITAQSGRLGAGRGLSVLVLAVALLAGACTSGGSASPSQSSAPPSSGGSGSSPSGSATSPSGSGGGSAIKADSLDAACSSAEGELNYSTTSDPQDFAKEAAAFNAKYPNIKINFTSLRPEDIAQRITAEVQAGRTTDIDVMSVYMQVVYPFTQAGMAGDVDWASVGVPDDLIQEVNGIHVWRNYRIVLGLGYNTTKTDASQLPDTWEGLVDAKYGPNKIVVDPRGNYLSELAISWGKDKTVDWLTRLMSTAKPLVLKGATASMEKVISGEALITTSSHNSDITQQKANGAPVAIKYLDVVPADDFYEVMVKGTPHPNAALCFMGWWGSADGQAEQLKVEYRNAQTPEGLPAGIDVSAIQTPQDAQTVADTAKALSDVIAGQ